MKKKKMILGVVVMLGVALLPLPSKAVLQANPNTNGTKINLLRNWLINVRNMETKNQAMGLEETINGTTKKATSPSNGIDVHMIKTTEWGTVAILSASGYGNSKKIQDSEIKSTTGNKTGVYYTTGQELTAGGISELYGNLDSRYYNIYTLEESSAKVGDALGAKDNINPRL